MIKIICLVHIITNGEEHLVIKLVLHQMRVMNKQMKKLSQREKVIIHKLKVIKIAVAKKVMSMMIRLLRI